MKKRSADASDSLLLQLLAALGDDKSIDLSSSAGLPPSTGSSQLSDDVLRGVELLARAAQASRRRLSDDPTASLGDVLSASIADKTVDLTNAVPWGPLLLLEAVGRGSFGEVYRAWYPSLQREVALKRLQFEAGDRERAAAVLREGQLLARVRHPNVITVHGAQEIADEVGIWMEFVRGRTLESLVRESGPMSAQEAAVVGECLCLAVSAAHQAGVLHGDIKASNVMREAGGRIVLLDFGAGSDVVPGGGSGRVVGTPAYLAPELFEGAPPSQQSDIYSLGVLLFYLATGGFPVSGKSFIEIRDAHDAGSRALLSDVRPDLPRQFVKVVERATAPKPEQRYRTAGAMLQELTESGVAPAISTGVRARVGFALLAVAGLVALLTFLGYVTSLTFREHFGLTSEFLDESPVAYLRWGAMNIVPTVFYMTIGALLFRAARFLGDVSVRMVPALRQPIETVGQRWQSWRRRIGLDEAAVPAIGLGALIVIFVLFLNLIAAVTARIDEAPMSTLTPLHPSQVDVHVYFGMTLDLVVLVMLAGLASVVRTARATGSRIPPGPAAGMAGVALLAMIVHAGAWRILYKSEFRQITVGGQTCYALGQNSNELLVHCPGSAARRNRVLSRTDPSVAPTGIVESLAASFVDK